VGLSEPGIGLDLPSVLTNAMTRDGKWYHTGTKRFQTFGCGGNCGPAILLALAKPPRPVARSSLWFLNGA